MRTKHRSFHFDSHGTIGIPVTSPRLETLPLVSERFDLKALPLCLVLFAATTVLAQAPAAFTPASKPLAGVMGDDVQSVLAPCSSWRPSVTTNPKDQQNNKHLQDQTDTLVALLIHQVAPGSSGTTIPNQYNGSFLRLLDSIDNFSVQQADPDLLGLAQLTDPSLLNLWGTNLATIKFDCSSMLSLLTQANASYSIPLVSLNAAFQANAGNSQKETSVFMSGLFQSPFEVLYNGQNTQGPQQTFAAFKALSWRLKPAHTGPGTYISTAYFLTMNTNVTSSDTLSILGNFKAGVNIPFAQLSVSVSGQLSNSLQTNSQSYQTYFLNPITNQLPSLSSLTTTIQGNIPQLKPSTTALRADQIIAATTSVLGWPAEVCKSDLWTVTFGNSLYKLPGGGTPLQLTPSPGASNGLPSCAISITLQATGGVGDISDPQMAMQIKGNNAASIKLSLVGSPHWLNKPQLKAFSPVAAWTGVQPDPATKVNRFLQWSFEVVANYPGRNITSMLAERDSFRCVPLDGSPALNLSSGNVNGSDLPTTGSPLNPDQPVNALLTTLGAQKYNSDPNQSHAVICRITGTIDVGSQDQSDSTITSTDPLTFQTDVVYFPNLLPTSPPTPPTGISGVSGNTQVSLSWTATSGAESYEVYRSSGGGAPVKIASSTTITKPSYQDTGLTNGLTYYYTVDAVNAAGPSPQSNPPVAATPLNPPLAPVMSGVTPGNSQVSLSWAPSASATSYNIYRSTVSATYTGRPVGTVPGTTYTDSGLANGTPYFYVVSGVNSAGEGPKGNEVTQTPKP
jgi:hypothetical protein